MRLDGEAVRKIRAYQQLRLGKKIKIKFKKKSTSGFSSFSQFIAIPGGRGVVLPQAGHDVDQSVDA